MNSGLKKINNQLVKELDGTTFNVNLNNNESNLIIDIPIIQTTKLTPISLNLVYNYQDKNYNYGFGNGVRLSLFCELTEYVDEDKIIVKNADGSIDEYEKYTPESVNDNPDLEKQYYKNESLKMEITKENDLESGEGFIFKLFDKYKNTKYYKSNNLQYPFKIETSSNETYTIDFNSETKVISNNRGDIVEILIDVMKFVTFNYYETYSGTKRKVSQVDVILTPNDNINFVDYYINDYLYDTLEFEIQSNKITASHYETNNSIEFDIVNNKIVSIIDKYKNLSARVTNISYANNKTVVTNFRGEKEIIYFDLNNRYIYSVNNLNEITGAQYHENTELPSLEYGPLYYSNNKNIFKNIKINNFTNTGLTITKVNCNDSDLYGLLNSKLYKVSGTGKLTYKLPYNGLGSDNLTFGIWIKQLTSFSDTKYVEITMKGCKCERRVLKDDTIKNIYEYIVSLQKAETSYDEIFVEFDFYGGASLEIGEITVLNQMLGSFYEYDEYNNILSVDFDSGSSSYVYDEKNNNIQTVDNNSTTVNKEYNNDRLVNKAKTYYGVTVSNIYDQNKKLIEKNLYSSISNKQFEYKRSYSLGNEHQETIYDELLNIQANNKYDYLGRILQSVDYLSNKTDYVYSNDNKIMSLTLTNADNYSTSVNYRYDSYGRINKVILNNGSEYEYVYDNFDQITKVKVNNQVIIEYVYDYSSGNLINKKYAVKDFYRFTYNNKNNPLNVYYIDENGNEYLKYTYNYNSQNELISITDSNNNILEEYQYDTIGKLIKVINSFGYIDYSYDNQKNINNEVRKVNDKWIHQSYDTFARSKGSNPENLKVYLLKSTDYFTCLFDESYNMNNGLTPYFEFKPFTKTCEGIIPYLKLNSRYKLAYNLKIDPEYPDSSGAIGFWFKLNTNFVNNGYLFSSKSCSDSSFLGVYLNNNKLYLEAIDMDGNHKTLCSTTKTIKSNEWNFFALTYMNRQINANDPDICEYELTLNNESVSYKQQDPRLNVNVGNEPLYFIGYKFDGVSFSNYFYSKIACLMIGRNSYVSRETIKKYYRTTRDYLIDNQIKNEETTSVDFSIGRTHVYDENIINNFDIYHLNNSVVSIKGKKPYEFNVRKISEYDKDRTFNFNKEIGDYAYIADGSSLKYKYNCDNAMSMCFKLYVDGIDNYQYIFDAENSHGHKIDFYINSSNYLCLRINSIIINSYMQVDRDKWNYVGVSMKKLLSSDSLTSNLSVNIFLNDDVYEYLLENCTYDLTEMTVSIGSRLEYSSTLSALGTGTTNYPLLGLIEWLAVSEKIGCNNSVFGNLCDNLKSYNKITLYDEFGLPQKNVVATNNSTALSNTYEYKSNESTSTKLISKEIIKSKDNTVNREYEYDRFGRVTKIIDSEYGTHNYEYDYRGFLVKDNNKTYEYDNNGNIINNNGVLFTYDSTIKDRLNNVGTEVITYNVNNPFYISETSTKRFEYEGKNLVSVFDKNTNNTTTFKYDSNGRRIEKNNSTGKNYKYIYSGNRLISEICEDYRNDFLYDENGLLYGFINNFNNKYFYIRDVLGNILGITLQDGEVVVKYEIDAYGNTCNITGSLSSTIGLINPFRYKGYYYDVETNLFLVSSRYYSPELCRWISPDDIEYLDPESVNGLNLYCYCLNNPIMYVDPDGHMPKWAQWVVGGLAVAGLIVATVLTCGAAGAGAAAVGAAMLTGGLVSAGINVVDQLHDGGSFDWTELAISTLSGTAYGLVVGLSGGAAAGAWSWGAFAGKLAVAGGTSLLNSWNENASFGETMKSLGFSLLASGAAQGLGYGFGKIMSKIPKNPTKLMTLGDIGSYLWGVPAIKTGVIRFGVGVGSAIFNDIF